MFGLDHVAADQQEQQRRGDAGEEHVAPAIASDKRVNLAPDDAPHRAASHHDAEDLGAIGFGKGLRHQRDADNDLGSGADPREKAIDPQIERRLRQPLKPGEDAVDHNAERQGAHPADVVGDDAESKTAQRPAEQPDGAEDPTDSADIGNARLSTQQLRQCRAQYQREQAKISGVERPARPGDKENQPLVPSNAPNKSQ